jgi:hypothetical protein
MTYPQRHVKVVEKSGKNKTAPISMTWRPYDDAAGEGEEERGLPVKNVSAGADGLEIARIGLCCNCEKMFGSCKFCN